MEYDSFITLIKLIVDEGETPRLNCNSCGASFWMCEGSFKHAYHLFTKKCWKCGSVGKTLVGDGNAPEL